MEKIAMKCTRAEYESIKEFVGELTNPSKDDFKSYNYLTICSRAKTVYMISKGIVDHDKKIYETFDKAIFLKACDIKVSELKINLLDVEEALGKDTIVAINTRVKKGKNKKIFEKLNKLLKQLNKNKSIELGLKIDCDIKYEKLNFLDGNFKITITGNKTK